MRDEKLPVGTLPMDAQLRLKAAAKVGTPGSIVRRRAIARAYEYIDANYPEYLQEKECFNHGK